MTVTRPRIVYLISGLRTGGAQTGLKRLATSIDHDIYRFTIITVNAGIDDVGEWAPNDLEVIDLEITSIPRLPRVKRLWRELGEADILVCSLRDASILGRSLGALRPSLKIIDWRHNTSYLNRRTRVFYKLTDWIPDVIIADSRHVQSIVEQEVGQFDTPVRYVPIAGVDTNEFIPRDQGEAAESFTVVSIMRLTEQKNPRMLLELADRFSGEANVRFEVAGEGPLLESLRLAVDQRGLQNILFHGFVEDLPSFLSRGDVYVQPSRSEGLCITVPEAMACELPVVASAVGGIPESVVEGETGYLLQPEDVDGFEAKIRELLEDPERREAFGARGRTRVEEHYSRERLVSGFEAVVSICLE